MAPINLSSHLSSLLSYSSDRHDLSSLLSHSYDRGQLCHEVIPQLLQSISTIAKTLQASHRVSLVGTANAFGDEQLNVDVRTERIIRDAIRKCPCILAASSEEDPDERSTGHPASPLDEYYTVAFDPLDGSSIIAPNWTVGTIIGIWDGSTALGKVPAKDQIAAILGVYGPRTTAVVALRVPGSPPAVFEVGFIPGSSARIVDLIRPEVRLLRPPYKTRYFAPANLRSAAVNEKYMGLITHYVKEQYTLRFCGGLVPDIVHMLTKGHGVHIAPAVEGYVVKLRRLYELCPIALVIECAGGRAVDPVDGKDILSRPVEDCDERGGLVCGNSDDVEFVIKSLVG